MPQPEETGPFQVHPESLNRYRSWLGLLARLQKGSAWGSACAESDLVQQTLLLACRDLPQFQGQSEGELRAWLRKILAHVITRDFRDQRAQKRDVQREVSLDAALEASSLRLAGLVADSGPSPSAMAMAREAEIHLADVLDSLPPDYKEVILLRNIEGLSHDEVAKRMGRAPGAVRMLWIRALAKLKQGWDGAPPD